MEISLVEIFRRVGTEVLLVHRVSPQSSAAAGDGFSSMGSGHTPRTKLNALRAGALVPESDLDSGLNTLSRLPSPPQIIHGLRVCFHIYFLLPLLLGDSLKLLKTAPGFL